MKLKGKGKRWKPAKNKAVNSQEESLPNVSEKVPLQTDSRSEMSVIKVPKIKEKSSSPMSVYSVHRPVVNTSSVNTILAPTPTIPNVHLSSVPMTNAPMFSGPTSNIPSKMQSSNVHTSNIHTSKIRTPKMHTSSAVTRDKGSDVDDLIQLGEEFETFLSAEVLNENREDVKPIRESIVKKLSIIKEEEIETDSVQSLHKSHEQPAIPTVDSLHVFEPMEQKPPKLLHPLNTFILKNKVLCRCHPCHPIVKGFPCKKRIPKQPSESLSESDEFDDDEESFFETLTVDSVTGVKVNSRTYMEFLMFTLRLVIPSNTMLELKFESEKKFEVFALKWNYLEHSDRICFSELDNAGEFVIDYERVYPFIMDKATYVYLSKCSIHLELHVKYEDDKYHLLGIAELQLNQALNNLDNNYEVGLEIHNTELRRCGSDIPFISFGEVRCQIGFGGDKKRFKAAKVVAPTMTKLPVMGTGSYSALFLPQRPAFTDFDAHYLGISELELKAFQSGLNMVLIRNAALKKSGEQIYEELSDIADWLHEELLWQVTLQEAYILLGKDPTLVKWRQWKDASTNVRYRPNGNEAFKINKRAEFSITISDLEINPVSRILLDENIVQLYVEYSFLEHEGLEFETPSKRKHDIDHSIIYDFTKSFVIEKDDPDAVLLANSVRNGDSITFTLISEPLSNKAICQTCTDIGSCQINMYDLVQHTADSLSEYFGLMDHWEDDEVGKLRISIEGIYSMRSLALLILTPPSFDTGR